MAGARGQSGPDLIRLLQAQPWRFEALEAVRLLAAAGKGPVRLIGQLNRGFPPSEISSLTLSDQGVDLQIAGFGLADILPDAYLDLLKGPDGRAIRAFLAPLEDRLQRQRVVQQSLLAPQPNSASIMADALDALLGLSASPLPAAGSWRATTGMLARRPASLEAIELFVSAHLGLSVAVEPFAGRTVELMPAARTRIGSMTHRLGDNVVLGRRVYSAGAAIKAIAGPVPLADADRVVAESGAKMLQLAQFAAGTSLGVDCELALAPNSIDGSRLNSGRRLGQTSFLGRWRRGDAPRIRLQVPPPKAA